MFAATDFDGDSVVVDDGATVTIENDVPTIGPIANGLVDFTTITGANPDDFGGTSTSSVTNSLNGAVGADEPATYTITSSPASVTIFDGTSAAQTLLGKISDDGTAVTYFDDANGNGSIDSGETELHRKQRLFGFPKPVILTGGKVANALYKISDVKFWLAERERLCLSNTAPELKPDSPSRGRPPGAMIAVATGTIAGLVVLDIDVDAGKGIDGETALSGSSLPEELTAVRTPRGGRHIYFAYPEGRDPEFGGQAG